MIEQIDVFVTLSIVVTAIVELMKPGLNGIADIFGMTENLRKWFIMVVSGGVGVFAAVGGGVDMNILQFSPIYSQLNPWFGVVLTGIVIGVLGAKGIHRLFELLIRRPVELASVTVEAQSSPDVSWGVDYTQSYPRAAESGISQRVVVETNDEKRA